MYMYLTTILHCPPIFTVTYMYVLFCYTLYFDQESLTLQCMLLLHYINFHFEQDPVIKSIFTTMYTL